MSLGETLLASKDILNLDNELVDIIVQVQYITRYREYCLGHGYRVTPQEVEIFTLRRLDLEYRLMNRLFGGTIVAEDRRHRTIEISLLIFSVVNLDLITVTAGPFRTLLRQLMKSLEHPNLLSLWWSARKVLLWVLFLGAHISAHPKEQQWFVYRLAQLSPRLGIKGWDDARRMLVGCFYVDRMYEESFRWIWNQASELSCGRIMA